MADLYVYYKVRLDNTARLELLVRAMQSRLAAQHGVAVQVKRRPEAKDGMQTWMEVYPAVDNDFTAALAQAVRAAGLADLIEGPRHTEMFTDLTACA